MATGGTGGDGEKVDLKIHSKFQSEGKGRREPAMMKVQRIKRWWMNDVQDV